MQNVKTMNADDPFLFDSESLEKIASDNIIRNGLAIFRENRVVDVGHDPVTRVLWGKVEGDDPDYLLTPRAEVDEAGKLVFACGCGECLFHRACEHVVALLYEYADTHDETDSFLTANETALRDRIKRGRSEVRVRSLSGSPCYGEWEAWSLASTTHYPMRYRVTIRTLNRRANLCTCPDFANNQLGTCKHIEAVLHTISKHPDFERFRAEPPDFAYVYLSWEGKEGPSIRIGRRAAVGDDLQHVIDEYFDEQGVFRGRVPDDFFRFAQIVEERIDVDTGDDVLRYTQHLAETASRKVRVAEIRERLRLNHDRVPGIRARLYPYQVEGVAFLAGTGRALLADDMGLGKTLQAISAAVWLRENEGVRRILIICPASLKHQWAREIRKFTGLTCQVIQGNPAMREVQYRREAAFTVVNYELVLRDLSVINEKFCADLIIMDEAQRIKNWRTKIANAVKLIHCRYAFVLSGTPLENRLEDLYSLMQVVDARILGPLWRYMVDFHVTDERGKVLGYRNLTMLRKRIAPVMLRRDRRLVEDQLPDRIVQQLSVPMTQKQWELHDAALMAAGNLAQTMKNRPLTPSEHNRLMAALQQARMACNAAGLVDKKTKGSPKIDELAEIIEELCLGSGLKVVVFSQWELMTRMVEERLMSMRVGFVRLHGGVPTAMRGELMDRFREDDSVQVFISTDAGGVGLNLQSASVVVNLDMPWNPAILEQRNGRVHRLGQKRKVQIINMVAADSYEEHVFKLLTGKQHLFDNVISEYATEDVVGISKKLLETLVDDLENIEAAAERRDDSGEEGQKEIPPGPEAGDEMPEQEAATAGKRRKSEEEDEEVEQAITECIEDLQEEFGAEIERILGAGGGLLVVLDSVDEHADQVAARLSEKVPVAVIDARTLKGLQRLGQGSPASDAKVLFESDSEGDREDRVSSRLARLAEEKFKAAELLINQEYFEGAVDLLIASLLAAASARAGLERPVTVEEASVWLWEKAVPAEILDQGEAGLVMRALTLGQAPSLPEKLVVGLMEDVMGFVFE